MWGALALIYLGSAIGWGTSWLTNEPGSFLHVIVFLVPTGIFGWLHLRNQSKADGKKIKEWYGDV
jgi:hypothetical protein